MNSCAPNLTLMAGAVAALDDAGVELSGYVRFSWIASGKRDQRFDECIDRSIRYQDPAVILSVAGLPNEEAESVANNRSL